MPAMAVEVATAKGEAVIDEIQATGAVEAVQSIELRPEVEGRLVQIYVREGSIVRQGTPLFKIDDASLRAQVARAEAERDLAQQALARTRRVLVRGVRRPPRCRISSPRLEVQRGSLDLQRLQQARAASPCANCGLFAIATLSRHSQPSSFGSPEVRRSSWW
jgi:membrane fusion protein (multidrug efflux system)